VKSAACEMRVNFSLYCAPSWTSVTLVTGC